MASKISVQGHALSVVILAIGERLPSIKGSRGGPALYRMRGMDRLTYRGMVRSAAREALRGTSVSLSPSP